MRFAGAQAGDTVETSGERTRRGPGAAALASLGAGAIHATAVGVHGGHRQAAIAMGAVALFQLGWGAVSLVRSDRWVGWSGLMGHGVVIGGWMSAKTSGIPFVDGLDAAEPLQFADTAAAILATVAAIGALAILGGSAGLAGRGRAVPPPWRERMARALHPPATAAVAVFVAVAMLSASAHAHPGDHGSSHDGDDQHAHEGESAAGHGGDGHDGGRSSGDGHDGHGDDGRDDGHEEDDDGHDRHGLGSDHTSAGAPDGDHGEHTETGPPHDGHDTPPPGDDGHDHDDGSAKPYDATLPVDLGGVPGVTAEQQARAEAVVTATLVDLPQFADPAVAESRGYRSIGDEFTGYEHFVNWDLLGDGRTLDANHPESLVYKVSGEQRTLVSAMYFAEAGTTLAEAPDFGGPLTQWHVHDDLCFSGEQAAWRVGPVVTPPGTCPDPFVRLDLPPMIHVWIVPHRCGPFAALEGASGGQVGDGETVVCDHAHGSA